MHSGVKNDNGGVERMMMALRKLRLVHRTSTLHFYLISPIFLCHHLLSDECGVESSLLEEVTVAALFHHLSLVDDNDPVSFLNCAQSVSYHNHCATMKILIQSLLDLHVQVVIVYTIT